MNKVDFHFPDIEPLEEVCLITMVKDEEFFLPIWVEHYSNSFDKPYFIIFDHNSTVPVRDWIYKKYPDLKITVIDLPGIPFDDNFKSNTLSIMASTMTAGYRTVIVSDVDEIVLGLAGELSDILNYLPDHTAPLGMEFVQKSDSEPEYDSDIRLVDQRNSVQLLSGYTKPIIWKKPAKFSAGLHGLDRQYLFSKQIALAHLRFIDEKYANKRQMHRNTISLSQEQKDKNMGGHWLSKDSQWIGSWIFKKANSTSNDVSNEIDSLISEIVPKKDSSGFYRHSINKASKFLDFNKVIEILAGQ